MFIFNDYKRVFILLISLCILLGVSCVSASDFDNSTALSSDLGNNIVYPESANVVNPISGIGELERNIQNLKPGDVYVVDKDYDVKKRIGSTWIINVAVDNVTIDGNGHYINAGGAGVNFGFFNVTGNNVKIINFVFNNSQPYSDRGSMETMMQHPEEYIAPWENCYDYKASPFYWSGDNGYLSNCAFIENRGGNGILNWMGNNGIIENCMFVNNSAYGVGGAILIGGSNNRISNIFVYNSVSRILGDAIYADLNRKNLTFQNITFDQSITCPIVDGAISGVDVDNAFNRYYSIVADKSVNLVDLLFVVLSSGGVHRISDDISYYAEYLSGSGELILSVNVEYPDDDITYRKDYLFRNIRNYTYENVFTALYSENYENYFTLTRTLYVASEFDYKEALIKGSDINYGRATLRPVLDILSSDMSSSNIIPNVVLVTNALNVIFKDTLKIYFHDRPWDMTGSYFDVININGKGSAVYGGYDDDDEIKWAIINKNRVFAASNITVEGFNTAVENWGGKCMFSGVNFIANSMEYMFDRDWGAAIINTGEVICKDCLFALNYAKNGGAIFNQGMLIIENCSFEGNHAYGLGDDICVGDGGRVIIDGEFIWTLSENEHVVFTESMSDTASFMLSLGTYVTSFVAGVVISAFTMNLALGFAAALAVGMAAGAAIGAVIGAAASAYIISDHYDVNFNRGKTATFLILANMFYGASGAALYMTVNIDSYFYPMATMVDLEFIHCCGSLAALFGTKIIGGTLGLIGIHVMT